MRRAHFLFLAASAWLLSGFVTRDMRAAELKDLYGVLQDTPAHWTEERAAGLSVIVLEPLWTRYEPQPGVFDTPYIDELKKRLADARRAGFRAVLSPGWPYPPAWIFHLPHSRYVDQYGDVFSDSSPGMAGFNAVFDPLLRAQQEIYLRRLLADLGTDFLALRLGGGWHNELNYPPDRYHGHLNCYWGFDDLAQGRAPGLPPGIVACPTPGWLPGTAPDAAGSRHARLFSDWHLDSLKNYHDWQIVMARRVFENPAGLTFILSLPNVLSLIIAPVTSFLSDRVWTRVGRRKPFVIASWLGMGASQLLMPLMPNAWGLVATFLVYQVARAIGAPIEPLKQEIIPPAERGFATGAMTWRSKLATITFYFVLLGRFDDTTFLAGLPVSGEEIIYWSAALLIGVVLVIVVPGIRETDPHNALRGQRLSWRNKMGTYGAGATLITKIAGIITLDGVCLFVWTYAVLFQPPAGEMTRLVLRESADRPQMLAALGNSGVSSAEAWSANGITAILRDGAAQAASLDNPVSQQLRGLLGNGDASAGSGAIFWDEFAFQTTENGPVRVRGNAGSRVRPLYPLIDAEGLPTRRLIAYDRRHPQRVIFPGEVSTWLVPVILMLGGVAGAVISAVLFARANVPIALPEKAPARPDSR